MFRRPLLVATTHLLFSPRRREVRLAQTAVLLAHIDRLAWDGESRKEATNMHTSLINEQC